MPFVGMEDEDRRNITRNIGTLVEQTNIDVLIPKLLEKGVFNSMMIETYRPGAGLNVLQRTTALYLDIQRRGPEAFGKLISSLVETRHYELAKLLQPDLDIHSLSNGQEFVARDALLSDTEIPGSTVNNLPAYYPRNLQNRLRELSLVHPNAVINLNTEPLQVSVKHATSRLDLQPPKLNLMVYPMGSRPKGYFFMINNIKFVNNVVEERKGAEVDDLNLTILFQQLGYEVKSFRNQSVTEMMNEIKQFAEMEELKSVHSCIVAILSHGDTGTDPFSTDFVASDGGRLSSTWVLECFNNYNCPNLMGKPKIFIFQTCRGEKLDYGVKHMVRPTRRVERDGYPASQIRTYSDILIAYSTIPGYISNRDIYCGTWYIQTLCKIFMDHAHDTEIHDMLIMVDNNIKHLLAEDSTMQTSSFENWGFQKFYFNPGLYDSPPTSDSSPDSSLNNQVPETAV